MMLVASATVELFAGATGSGGETFKFEPSAAASVVVVEPFDAPDGEEGFFDPSPQAIAKAVVVAAAKRKSFLNMLTLPH
jgi:hypothetical protein